MDAVPDFLVKAAGIRSTDPVVITFYGESGSDHFRWRSREEGGGAQPMLWSDAIAARVEARLADELNMGRQLGFIAALGGSKKHQISNAYGLRAEIDLPDSKAPQRQPGCSPRSSRIR